MALTRRLQDLENMGHIWQPLLANIPTLDGELEWPMDWGLAIQSASIPKVRVDAPPIIDAEGELVGEQTSDDDDDGEVEEALAEDPLIFEAIDNLDAEEHRRLNR